MAFDPLPTEVFAGWSEDGTDITIPIASIPQLTAAEADAATGDSRKVVWALAERLYAWYAALAVADRPTRMSVSRSSSPPDQVTGLITRTISIRTILDPGALEVADE